MTILERVQIGQEKSAAERYAEARENYASARRWWIGVIALMAGAILYDLSPAGKRRRARRRR